MDLIYQGPSERVDIWLTKQFPYTRSFFHHIIARGGIQILGKAVKKSYILKNGDQIHVDDLQRYLGSEILEETPKIDIPIVLEKEEYLIINKPKGVLSHPRNLRELNEPSVVGFLYHTYKDLPSIGNFIRAGLLHRLDKETDGLMIIAKTEKGLAHFKNLFDEKTKKAGEIGGLTGDGEIYTPSNLQVSSEFPNLLQKFYRAGCHITPEGEKFLESIQLPYYIQEPVIAKIPYTTPKMGITKILNSKKSDHTVILELEILTGRTHQIRYHLAHHGLPIIGDYLYGKDEGIPMQLTAYKLIFKDPNDEIMTIEI